MKVGIIGAGSIGLLLASYLNSVFEVTLYTRTNEQAGEINLNGLHLNKEQQTIRSSVKAAPFSEWQGTEPFTIVAVKEHQLDAIIEDMADHSIHAKGLLFIQNGMGHLQKLDHISADNIFVGVVEHGALKLNAYTVCHNGNGAVKAAVYRGEAVLLHKVISALSTQFPIIYEEDYEQILLHKLIINAAINPLTAILQVSNGELVENEYYFKALKNLFEEIVYILNIKDPHSHFEKVTSICKNTAANRSSMLADIEAKRKTEVESIVGFLLQKANEQHKKVPLLTNLYYLIKGKEHAWRDSI
jgi:2-dehydropantoate 2-reductase